MTLQVCAAKASATTIWDAIASGPKPEQRKGRLAPPYPFLFGHLFVVVIAFWEGHHFDAGEHIVFDLD
jgi:hypothetical protein